ncbi:hypothetical protein AGR1A_Lc100006 [Agrobacterium fabacearum CFBP 5771]|nr:hypothetical protein AGR1A_Lc100006 [Agrobacterium fabacearum CFBP 5771]
MNFTVRRSHNNQLGHDRLARFGRDVFKTFHPILEPFGIGFIKSHLRYQAQSVIFRQTYGLLYPVKNGVSLAFMEVAIGVPNQHA